jgi:hypothetical protein
MDTFKLKVELGIPGQLVHDVLTTAVEGGIGYWINSGDFKNVTIRRDDDLNVTAIFFEGTGQIPVTYKDRGPCFAARPQDDRQFYYMIYPGDIILAAQKILDAPAEKYGAGAKLAALELIKGVDADIDADAADCLLQVAAFDEVVYG